MESIDIDLFDNIQQGAAMRRKYVSEPKERFPSRQASCPAGGEGQLCIYSGSHFYREVIFIETAGHPDNGLWRQKPHWP